MNLFTVDHNRVIATPEALLIKEFKDIWEDDSTRTKAKAVEEFAYVYYMADYQSVYRQYDPEIRGERVKKDVISKKSWKPDDRIETAIKKYNELQQTASMGVLQDARVALHKIRKYFRTVDVTTDKTGRFTETLINNVSKLGGLIKGLKTLEEMVEKEISEDINIRGKGKLALREVPKKTN